MALKKKTIKKKSEIQELSEFVRDHMLTKDDVRDIVREEVRDAIKPVETRLTAVESKFSGIDHRLDVEAMARTDEKISARVADVEIKVFGKSRQPDIVR